MSGRSSRSEYIHSPQARIPWENTPFHHSQSTSTVQEPWETFPFISLTPLLSQFRDLNKVLLSKLSYSTPHRPRYPIATLNNSSHSQGTVRKHSLSSLLIHSSESAGTMWKYSIILRDVSLSMMKYFTYCHSKSTPSASFCSVRK